MKKLVIFFLSLVMVFGALTIGGTGLEASAAKSNVPKFEDIDYEGNGRVDVDFCSRVVYKDAKVKVKDSDGKSYTASIVARDNDEVDFKIKNFATGKTYTFTISGIKVSGTDKYTSVTGKVKIPAPSLYIKEVDCDIEDKELSVEFNCKVNYSGVKVTVKDSKGNTYSTKILEKDKDEIEVRVSGLKNGSKYTVSVSGVKRTDASSYTTVSKTFVAYDD